MDYVEMLSRLGAGSAHPGGFKASIEQLQKYPLPSSGSILEVGCGTGRTACYLAEQGYQVVAVDIHPQMLAKAKQRAKDSGLEVAFQQADAHALPFADNSFDVLLAESVTNFTRARQSVAEYLRVLKPGGVLYNREMLVRESISENIRQEISAFYGMPHMMNRDEWRNVLADCGFNRIDILEVNEINEEKIDQQYEYPDVHQVIDDGVLFDIELLECGIQSSWILLDNKDQLEYGVIRAFK